MTTTEWIAAITVFLPDRIRTIETRNGETWTYVRTADGNWRKVT